MPGTRSSKVGTSSPLWFITSPFWHCSLQASHSSTSGLLYCSFLFHNPPAGTSPDCRQAGLAAGQFPSYVCRMRFGFWVTEKSNTFSKKKKRLKKLHILFSVNVALTDVVIPASLWMPALNFVQITELLPAGFWWGSATAFTLPPSIVNEKKAAAFLQIVYGLFLSTSIDFHFRIVCVCNAAWRSQQRFSASSLSAIKFFNNVMNSR